MEVHQTHYEELKGYDNDCRTAMTWAPEARRRWGRPSTTWRRTAEKGKERAKQTRWSEAFTAAADRAVWRQSVEALCATWRKVGR